MQDIDALLEVLRRARAEGALEGEGLEAFARGLRARADLVIEERVARAEAQVRRLEQEATWRRETNEALERETAWRREANEGLEQTNAALERENTWRQETNEALERVVASLRAEVATSAEAHDRLLSHHRDVLGRVAAELAAVAALPFYSLRSARRRLVSLAATIRGEIA